MPARDIYHDHVKNALLKDGWTITDDPYKLKAGRTLYVDLGAERVVAAEKENRKIAVEIKSFRGPSEMRDLEQALGQFVLYQQLMELQEPDRVLYLAISQAAFVAVFAQMPGRNCLIAKACG